MTKDARRIAFAKWITSKDNPMFAKVMANRLWKRVMGIGLHEPIDDWKEGAEGINPALMKYLAGEFIRLKFDVKEFMRGLLKSGTYQAHAMGEEDLTTAKYAAQATLLRRMSAEQVFDSWLTLIVPELDARKRQPSPLETFLVGYQTGPRTAERAVDMMIKFKKGEYGNMMTRMRMTYPSGHKGMMRASEMLYPADYGSFMNIFGQSPREEVSGGSTEPGLQQVLFLLNGDMSYKVLGRDSQLRKNLDAAKSNVQKINILFLSILNRYPGAREMEVCRKEMETNGFDGVANIARALLNGREFLFIQ